METSKSKEITEVNNLKEKHKKCTHNDIILALNPEQLLKSCNTDYKYFYKFFGKLLRNACMKYCISINDFINIITDIFNKFKIPSNIIIKYWNSDDTYLRELNKYIVQEQKDKLPKYRNKMTQELIDCYNKKNIDLFQLPENSSLHKFIKNIAKKNNIEMPHILIPNIVAHTAFSHSSTNQPIIVIDKGMFYLYSKCEIDFIICHELCHIKNKDTKDDLRGKYYNCSYYNLLLVSCSISVIYSIQCELNPIFIYFILLIIFCFIKYIIACQYKRQELTADKFATNYINENICISALNKMSIHRPYHSSKIRALFSTHPSMKQRIKKIKSNKNYS